MPLYCELTVYSEHQPLEKLKPEQQNGRNKQTQNKNKSKKVTLLIIDIYAKNGVH